MDPQYHSRLLQNSSFVDDPFEQKSGNLVRDMGVGMEGFIGVLDVCIHQAIDIHNICIYHKQDVYAKFWLSSDPDRTVLTRVVNGGGMNPVFEENLRLDVRMIDSSLRCEIWMLSRIRNYLEDQLLGFALVRLSDVLVGNGTLAKEFALSSTSLGHSPAGFVQLTLSYAGDSPDVWEIPAPGSSVSANAGGQDSEVSESLPCELDKIEFPDPRIANENHIMVSEYVRVLSIDLGSQTSDSSGNSNFGASILESSFKVQSCLSSVLANGSPSIQVRASSQSTKDTEDALNSPVRDLVSCTKEKVDIGEAESDFSVLRSNAFDQPIVRVNIVEEQKLVQAEIVDMYLKSMQQFTDSLAKMKLPMDIDNGPKKRKHASSENEKLKESKTNGSRVYYGSNAFF